jgi:hypothetical protein
VKPGWPYNFIAEFTKILQSCSRVLVEKILFGRPIQRWESVKMNLTEIDWEGVDRIDLAQDREKWWDFVQGIVKLWVP